MSNAKDYIREITVSNIGIIERATLEIDAGFTVITGETGAGKTMLLQAFGLLLGKRADASVLRDGCERGWVEGLWSLQDKSAQIDFLHQIDADIDRDESGVHEVVVARSVSSKERSKATVGGRSVAQNFLETLGQSFVVIHGQADQLRLRSRSAQRLILDRFAGNKAQQALERYGHTFVEWKRLTAELEHIEQTMSERELEISNLQHTVEDIAAVDPIAGEELELAQTIERLTHREHILQALFSAQRALSSEHSDEKDGLSLLHSAKRSLDQAVSYDPVLQELADALESAVYALQDCAAEISSQIAQYDEADVLALERANMRQAQLNGLIRKFGPDLDRVIDTFMNAQKRLDLLNGQHDSLDDLRSQVDHYRDVLWREAKMLSDMRIESAQLLQEHVSQELHGLAMPNSQFIVDVTHLDQPTEHGIDTVQFLWKPHTSGEAKLLRSTASGGELSRVMLALEVVIAQSDPVPTFIFDEVDAGIGGSVAIEVGKRLQKLAQTAQVIVVTHLPQVAAFATTHVTIAKESNAKTAVACVKKVEGSERLQEMARLLSGLPDSQTGLTHAKELLELATST